MLRNGKPLRVQELDATRIGTDKLRFSANREGNLLSFQLNTLPPMEFNDGFPLPTATTVSLTWPDRVPLDNLAIFRRFLSAAPSPLEEADALYDRGEYDQALEKYSFLATASKTTALRQESAYKMAMCLAGANRRREALVAFQTLAAESGDRWPVLAKLQLCVDYVTHNQFDEADIVFESLTTDYKPEEVVAYVPADVGTILLGSYQRRTFGSTYFHIRPDGDRIAKRKRLLAMQKLLGAPRQQIVVAQALLMHTMLAENELNSTIELARELTNDSFLDPYPDDRLQMFACYAKASIQLDRAEDALPYVNQWLSNGPGKNRKEYLPLLLFRAQLHLATGDATAAMQDVEQFMATQPSDPKKASPALSLAYLLKGFLYERGGNREAAEKSWKTGFELSRKRANLSNISDAIMGSLSNALTTADADAFLDNVVRRNITGGSRVLRGLQHGLVPSTIVASVMRNMWRSRRGREYARKLAFGALPDRLESDSQVMLTAAEIFRLAIQGTEDLSTELTPDEDALIWNLVEELFAEYKRGKLTEISAMQYYFALMGRNNAVGWQALAPSLPPPFRGPLSYICGRRYVHLNRLEDAKGFFRGAVKDAAPGSITQHLAEVELKGIDQVATGSGGANSKTASGQGR
jgi:tetratricopeptide (TPR) repeat protein